MRLLAALAAVILAACGQTPRQATIQASPSASTSATSSAQPSALPPSASEPSPASAPRTEPSPTPATPSVHCVGGYIPSYQALMTGYGGTILYDVGDPLHPHAVCKISNTRAHIVTGTAFEYLVPRPDGTTDVVLHALGSNNESVAANFKADLYHGLGGWYNPIAWGPGLSAMAYLADGGTDAQGFGVTDVWLATTSGRFKIDSYSVPGRDAFGRPGFAPLTLAFSLDAAYLVAGWTVATSPVRVFRVSDHANVTPAWPADFRSAFWGKKDDTLFIVGLQSVASWKPGGVVTTVPSTPAWVLDPNLSPDGTQVAFTALTSTRDVRPYVYDLNARTSRLLINQSRSSVSFVRSGLVWYAEEKPCVQSDSNPCFDPTQPDGNVLGFELATGRETLVTFAPGESLTNYGFASGDLWPST